MTQDTKCNLAENFNRDIKQLNIQQMEVVGVKRCLGFVIAQEPEEEDARLKHPLLKILHIWSDFEPEIICEDSV